MNWLLIGIIFVFSFTIVIVSSFDSRCQKLKILPGEYGVKKLSEVPRLERAVLITRDRLLVVDYTLATSVTPAASSSSSSDATAATAPPPPPPESTAADFSIDGDDDGDESEKGAAVVDAASAVAAGDSGSSSSSATTTTTTEGSVSGSGVDGSGGVVIGLGAVGLRGLKCMVKSNHHLTEVVKMTLLKREQDVLTLHFRNGAAFDTATLEVSGGNAVFIMEEAMEIKNDAFFVLLSRASHGCFLLSFFFLGFHRRTSNGGPTKWLGAKTSSFSRSRAPWRGSIETRHHQGSW
jgi:hypothetical protein